jgi:hypothetical protein
MPLGPSSEQRDLAGWTRSLPLEDVLLALAEAEPGLPLGEWRQRCDRSLPHASATRRADILRFVSKGLLDHDGKTIQPTRFLQLVRSLGAKGQRELVWGRYLMLVPVVDAALRELVAPVAALLDEPLKPCEDLQLSSAQWTNWLTARLAPSAGAKSVINSKGNLITALRRVGSVIQRDRGRITQVVHGQPEGVAFAWLIAHELRLAQRIEAAETWAVNSSFAARLFLPTAHHAQVCIEQGVAAGILQRSYLAGEPRLLVPVEA